MATITPGYWYCPRCQSKDLYRAPRQVGSVGIGRAFDGFDSDSDLESIGLVQRPLELQVWLCRNCGERAVHQKQVKHLTLEEQKSSDTNFGAFLLTVSVFSFVGGISSVKSEDSWGWLFIVAGLFFGSIGLLVLSSNPKNRIRIDTRPIVTKPTPSQTPPKVNEFESIKLISCSKCRHLYTSALTKCPFCQTQT